MTGRLLLPRRLLRRRRRSRYQPCWHRWRRRLRPTARPTVSVIVMTHRRCHYQLCWYRGRRRLHPGPGRDTSRRDSVHWPPMLCSTAWGTAQCSGGLVVLFDGSNALVVLFEDGEVIAKRGTLPIHKCGYQKVQGTNHLSTHVATKNAFVTHEVEHEIYAKLPLPTASAIQSRRNPCVRGGLWILSAATVSKS